MGGLSAARQSSITNWLRLDPIPSDIFSNINTILVAFVLIPITPLILESQGFYKRQMLGPRGAILWPLLKGCTLTTIALVLAGFVLRLYLPRWVPVWFGAISFALIYCKEEILRLAVKSRFGPGPIQTPLHPRRHRSRNRPHVPGTRRAER